MNYYEDNANMQPVTYEIGEWNNSLKVGTAVSFPDALRVVGELIRDHGSFTDVSVSSNSQTPGVEIEIGDWGYVHLVGMHQVINTQTIHQALAMSAATWITHAEDLSEEIVAIARARSEA